METLLYLLIYATYNALMHQASPEETYRSPCPRELAIGALIAFATWMTHQSAMSRQHAQENPHQPEWQEGGAPGATRSKETSAGRKQATEKAPLADVTRWTRLPKAWMVNFEMSDIIKFVLEPTWTCNGRMLAHDHFIPDNDKSFIAGLTCPTDSVPHRIVHRMGTEGISPYFILNPGESHWRIVTIDTNTRTIYYIDPLGRTNFPSPELETALNNRLGPGFQSRYNYQIYQNDSYNCVSGHCTLLKSGGTTSQPLVTKKISCGIYTITLWREDCFRGIPEIPYDKNTGTVTTMPTHLPDKKTRTPHSSSQQPP